MAAHLSDTSLEAVSQGTGDRFVLLAQCVPSLGSASSMTAPEEFTHEERIEVDG